MRIREIRTASPSEGSVKIVGSITFSIFLRQVACRYKALVDQYFAKVLLECPFIAVAHVVERGRSSDFENSDGQLTATLNSRTVSTEL